VTREGRCWAAGGFAAITSLQRLLSSTSASLTGLAQPKMARRQRSIGDRHFATSPVPVISDTEEPKKKVSVEKP
jgi:hypothetical protein